MRKFILMILALLTVLSILSGCQQKPAAEPEAVSTPAAAEESSASTDIKTMADVYAMDIDEEIQTAFYGKYYVYVFDLDGVPYRAIASVPQDVSDALFALDFDDPDFKEKAKKLSSPLEVVRYENVNDFILSQEELDQLIGKTGSYLFENGWTNSGWYLEEMEFSFEKNCHSYKVIMEGSVENADDFTDQDIYPLVIKSITYDGLGDATILQLDENENLID